MMKLISLISLCFITIYSSAQFEESIPLSGNPVLMSKSFTDISKINVGTFDSTFIYLLDTLTINVGHPYLMTSVLINFKNLTLVSQIPVQHRIKFIIY